MGPGVIDAKPYTYVALHDQSAVAVYDHGSSAWLGSIAVGTAPVGVTASPNQQRVYVSNHAANTVSVIRTADRAVIATVNVGSRPMGVAISPTQPRAYVANFGGNTGTGVSEKAVGFEPVTLPDGSAVHFSQVNPRGSIDALADWPGIAPAMLRRFYSALWEERQGNFERLPDGASTPEAQPLLTLPATTELQPR